MNTNRSKVYSKEECSKSDDRWLAIMIAKGNGFVAVHNYQNRVLIIMKFIVWSFEVAMNKRVINGWLFFFEFSVYYKEYND